MLEERCYRYNFLLYNGAWVSKFSLKKHINNSVNEDVPNIFLFRVNYIAEPLPVRSSGIYTETEKHAENKWKILV